MSGESLKRDVVDGIGEIWRFKFLDYAFVTSILTEAILKEVLTLRLLRLRFSETVDEAA